MYFKHYYGHASICRNAEKQLSNKTNQIQYWIEMESSLIKIIPKIPTVFGFRLQNLSVIYMNVQITVQSEIMLLISIWSADFPHFFYSCLKYNPFFFPKEFFMLILTEYPWQVKVWYILLIRSHHS